MIRAGNTCISCGRDKGGHGRCQFCTVSQVEAEKPIFADLGEERHKEKDENPAVDRTPEEQSENAFDFGSSHIEPVLIGIVLLLGIVLLYWRLGYLN